MTVLKSPFHKTGEFIISVQYNSHYNPSRLKVGLTKVKIQVFFFTYAVASKDKGFQHGL